MTETANARRRWRVAFVSATVAWALTLPIAAFAASGPGESSFTHMAAAVPYAIGAVVCHQLPARSFALWSRQLPVCARCTGIYAGAALAALCASAVLTKWRGAFSSARTLLMVAALPTFATLVYEWSAAVPPNAVRAIAGVPLGAAVALIILAALDDQVN